MPPSEEKIQYWPYSREQEEVIPKLMERFITWKKSISYLLSYFDDTMKLEKTISKVNLKLEKQLENCEEELGTQKTV